jgi:2'-5' RNA ligase
VAKERLKSPRARLFVALDLPEAVRAGLRGWQGRELGDPALRPVAAEALHITLCFLDHHPERTIERIAEVVTAVEARPIELRLDKEATPLPGGRPRLYAVGAASPAATELQSELSSALQAARFYEPEKRASGPT